MKLLSLKAYRHGYTGLVDRNETYVFFSITQKGTLKILKEYGKEDFINYNHFLQMISFFTPLLHFFKNPIEIDSLEYGEIHKLCKR